MRHRKSRMAYDGQLLEATGWDELGRRIREAAQEAVTLGIPVGGCAWERTRTIDNLAHVGREDVCENEARGR